MSETTRDPVGQKLKSANLMLGVFLLALVVSAPGCTTFNDFMRSDKCPAMVRTAGVLTDTIATLVLKDRDDPELLASVKLYAELSARAIEIGCDISKAAIEAEAADPAQT